jgi:hypothetical protein
VQRTAPKELRLLHAKSDLVRVLPLKGIDEGLLLVATFLHVPVSFCAVATLRFAAPVSIAFSARRRLALIACHV